MGIGFVDDEMLTSRLAQSFRRESERIKIHLIKFTQKANPGVSLRA